MRVSIHMGGLFLLSQARGDRHSRQALLTQQIVVILEFLWIKNPATPGGLWWSWVTLAWELSSHTVGQGCHL